ncbi:OmpH family outer membrane protein [Salmonella enterica subsp. diarizonae serovar 47:k:z53:[z84]]|nr:OmpH family outer membrane protein [Salmonella enterica subsp. diarizonae serovar 47:k:z53:[z84]]
MSSVMKFTVVNVIALILFTLFIGVNYMKKPKEIAIVNIDVIYKRSSAGKVVRNYLNEIQSVLEKGYEDAQNTFSDNSNKDALLLDARQKIERQYVIEEHNAKMVLSHTINEAINSWKKDNPKNITVLSSGMVLAYSDAADITNEIMHRVDKENLIFNKLPKVVINTGSQSGQDKSQEKN